MHTYIYIILYIYIWVCVCVYIYIAVSSGFIIERIFFCVSSEDDDRKQNYENMNALNNDRENKIFTIYSGSDNVRLEQPLSWWLYANSFCL